jgi:hypothetical protein
MTYWVKMKDGSEGCIGYDSGLPTGLDEKGRKAWIGERLGQEVREVQCLPYPACPLLLGTGPCFCYSPKECAGKSACPRNYSCCD